MWWIGGAVVVVVFIWLVELPQGLSHDHADGTSHRFLFSDARGYSSCACGARLNPLEEPYTPSHQHAWQYDASGSGVKRCACGTVLHPIAKET